MTSSKCRRKRTRAPLPMVDADMNDTVIDYMTEGKGPQEYNQAAVNFCVQQAMESWNSNPRKAVGDLRCAYCLFRLLPERSVYYPFGHDILCAAAYLLQHVGDLDDGLRMVDTALKVIPNVPATLFLKGYILLKRKVHAEAMRILTTVCKSNPKYTPWVDLVKAIFLLFDGNHDHAIASCGKVLVEYPYDKPLGLLAYWIRGHGYKYHPHGFFMNQAAEDYQVVLDHNQQWRTLLEKPFLPSRLGEVDDVLLMFLPWDFQPFGTTFNDYPLYSCPISWLHVLGLCLKAASRLKMRRQASVALKNLLNQQKNIKSQREEIEGRMRTIVTHQTKLEMEINDGHVVWGPEKSKREGVVSKYRRFWLEKPRCFPLRKDVPKPKKPRRPRVNFDDMELKWRPVGGGFAYGPRRVVIKPASPPAFSAGENPFASFSPNRRDVVLSPNRTAQAESSIGDGQGVVEPCEDVVRDVGPNPSDHTRRSSEYDRTNGKARLSPSSPQSPARALRAHAKDDENVLVKIDAIQRMQTELEVLQKQSMELENQSLPEEVLDAQVTKLHARTGHGIIEYMDEQPSPIPEKLEKRALQAQAKKPAFLEPGSASPTKAALVARIIELEHTIAAAHAPYGPHGMSDKTATCVENHCEVDTAQHAHTPRSQELNAVPSVRTSSTPSVSVTQAAVRGNTVGTSMRAPTELHAQLTKSETIGEHANGTQEAIHELTGANGGARACTAGGAAFSGKSGNNGVPNTELHAQLTRSETVGEPTNGTQEETHELPEMNGRSSAYATSGAVFSGRSGKHRVTPAELHAQLARSETIGERSNGACEETNVLAEANWWSCAYADSGTAFSGRSGNYGVAPAELHAQLARSETIGEHANEAQEDTHVLTEASDQSGAYTIDDAAFSGDSEGTEEEHAVFPTAAQVSNEVPCVEQPLADSGMTRLMGFSTLHGKCCDDLVRSPSQCRDSARQDAVPYSWEASARHPLTPAFSSIPCSAEPANEPPTGICAESNNIGADDIVRTAPSRDREDRPPRWNRPPEIASAWAKTAVGVLPMRSSLTESDTAAGTAARTQRATEGLCCAQSTALPPSAVASDGLAPCMGVAAPPLDALFRTHAQTSPRRATHESLCISVDRKNASPLFSTAEEKKEGLGDNSGKDTQPSHAPEVLSDEVRSATATWTEEEWFEKALTKADMFLGKIDASLPAPSSPRIQAQHAQKSEDLAKEAAYPNEDERTQDGASGGELRGYYQGVPLLDYMSKFGVEDVGVWFPALDRISKLSDGKLVTQQPCPFVQKTNFPPPQRTRPLLYPENTEKCRPWHIKKNVSGGKTRDHSAPRTDRRVVA